VLGSVDREPGLSGIKILASLEREEGEVNKRWRGTKSSYGHCGKKRMSD